MTPDQPHRRRNALTGDWVLVSAGRTNRPWQGAEESGRRNDRPQYDSSCYLCPGNERAGGAANPAYAGTYVFTNDYPALRPDGGTDAAGDDLFRWHNQAGTCRVVCFSPRHDLDLGRMDTAAVRAVIDEWATQTTELGTEYAWVQVFENRGAQMGASNPHPHGQIWATSGLSGEPTKELAAQAEYAASHGRSLLADYLERELADGTRVVLADDHWAVVVPYWAVWPFETLLLTRRPAERLADLDATRRDALAATMRALVATYDRVFDAPFPYSMGWHQAPFHTAVDDWWLHAHYYPPLLRSATVRKFMVGYELLAEPQRDITAEEAAARLRSV